MLVKTLHKPRRSIRNFYVFLHTAIQVGFVVVMRARFLFCVTSFVNNYATSSGFLFAEFSFLGNVLVTIV